MHPIMPNCSFCLTYCSIAFFSISLLTLNDDISSPVYDLIEIKPQLMDSENYLENIYNNSIHGSDAPDIYIMSADQLEKAHLFLLQIISIHYPNILQ